MSESTTVQLVISWAPLLSGGLQDCVNATDPSCEGGVAAVDAHVRHAPIQGNTLILPFLDRSSPFVQMHPLNWNVNRLVLHDILQWKTVWSAPPSVLTQSSVDYQVSTRDLSVLQSTEWPLLLTNAAVPPDNSWNRVVLPVHFDASTRLAVMLVCNSNQPLTVPSSADAVRAMLRHVERQQPASCKRRRGSQQQDDLYLELVEELKNTTTTTTTNNNTGANNNGEDDAPCWIPVVLYADVQEKFVEFVHAITNTTSPPPALVIDLEGNLDEFTQPTAYSNTWIVSHDQDAELSYHHVITVHNDDTIDVSVTRRDLTDVPVDTIYESHIAALHQQARRASQNDPVIGQTATDMPVTRTGSYRRCKAGECEIGNLFLDAAQWWAATNHDNENDIVAFTGSGGLRGTGWPAGSVRVSNVWEALPFPNTMCTGVATGVSLFQLFNYSINSATFEGENTNNGDRLLQVAGMRVTYNLQLPVPQRLVGMEIWNRSDGVYEPVERLQLYRFVTDSYMCSGFDPYAGMLSALVLPGEEPATIDESLLFQTIVGDYLSQLEEPYVPAIEGRLVNDTSITETLNLLQDADTCPPGTTWRDDIQTCQVCPDSSNVVILEQLLELEGQIGEDTVIKSSIDVVNGEDFEVAIVPRSKPSWLQFSTVNVQSSGAVDTISIGEATPINASDRLSLSLDINQEGLDAGTAQGTVTFGVLDGGRYPGCTGQDISFEARLTLVPELNLNQLGSIRYIGWSLTGIAVVASIFFSTWVMRYRGLMVVKTMQPAFLVTICVGVLVMSLTMIPLGIDDEIASQRGCDIACMSVPWLLSIGFTIAMSALFSKLWRINRLFRNAGMRRMRVTEKDVIGPFAILFSCNIILMLVWTLVDPITWERQQLEGPWNTYGSCQFSIRDAGATAQAMMVLVTAVNVFALLAAVVQAYWARNVGDEFSESKRIGFALFCWCQLFLVGGPVLFLIDKDNPDARYFIQVILVFMVAMSMLLVLFVPLLSSQRKARQESKGQRSDPRSVSRSSAPHFSVSHVGKTRVSGMNFSQLTSEASAELAALPFQEHNSAPSQGGKRSSMKESFPSMEGVAEVDGSMEQSMRSVIDTNGVREDAGISDRPDDDVSIASSESAEAQTDVQPGNEDVKEGANVSGDSLFFM